MPLRAPVSLRLDDEVRATLERDAENQGIGLATYLRRMAEQRARDVRKAEIRAESRRVGQLVLENDDAREFYEFWGTPMAAG